MEVIFYEIESGLKFKMQVSTSDTILQIKNNIEEQQSIPVPYQTLKFNGKIFRDDSFINPALHSSIEIEIDEPDLEPELEAEPYLDDDDNEGNSTTISASSNKKEAFSDTILAPPLSVDPSGDPEAFGKWSKQYLEKIMATHSPSMVPPLIVPKTLCTRSGPKNRATYLRSNLSRSAENLESRSLMPPPLPRLNSGRGDQKEDDSDGVGKNLKHDL